MKFTLGKIEQILSNPSLGTFLGKELPIAAAFDLTKIVRAMDVEFKLYQEKKKELLTKYAETDDEGNYVINGANVKLKEGTGDKFTNDMEELRGVAVKLSGCKKIKLKSTALPKVSALEIEAVYDLVTLV